ncbi:hypothetical protein DL240_05055 [Lujinxingia litoralis]|uniref:Sigma-54 factor interaction domain-containing protein n=1 Tax=Lujinxingia litoralis TaxID=2211119 RepID=A0A328C8P3_9DELT|nr:sigma 54-interacting transcriptional regulator [Lujinxingia litoralis]RAL23532.1 hypothetical protein DL240_05055 [Lujinxingia litoralis]
MQQNSEQRHTPESKSDIPVAALIEGERCGVVRCRGLSEASARLGEGGARAQLAERGWRYVVCDARHLEPGRSALQQMFGMWIGTLHPSGREAAEAQFDTLALLMRMQPGEQPLERQRLVCDATVGLSEELMEAAPVVLMVLAAEQLTSLDRAALRALVSYHAEQPLPGGGASHRLVVAVADQGMPLGEDLSYEDLEQAEYSREVTRAFLCDERVVDRVLASTGGCPERLEAILGALPASNDELATLRIARLSEGARHLFDYVALAGRELELSFVDGLLQGGGVVALRELRGAGLVTRRIDAGSVQINVASADLSRVALAGLGAERRRRLHAALAYRALECSSHGDAGFIAKHALAAGELELGARFALPAARQMMRWGRWEEARGLLKKLQTVELPPDEAGELHRIGAAIGEARGEWLEALAHCGHLRRYTIERKDRVALELRIAMLLVQLGRPELAEARYDEAARHLERIDSPADMGQMRVKVLLGYGEVAYQRGQHERAYQQAEAVLAQCERSSESGRQELAVRAHSLMGKVGLFRGELAHAREAFAASAALARRCGLEGEEARAEANLGVVAVQQRDYGEAQRRLLRALEQAQRGVASVSRLNCWLNLGIVDQRRGDYAGALAQFERSLRAAQAERHEVGYEVASHNLITLLQDMGAFEVAWEMIERAASKRSHRGHFASRWAPMLRAQLLFDQARYEEAATAFAQAEEHLAESPRLYGVEMRLRRAEALLELGQRARAQDVFQSVDVGDGDDPQSRALNSKLKGLMSCGAESAEMLDTAAVELTRIGLFRDGLSARVESARRWLELGQRERTRLLLERGLADLRERASTLPSAYRKGFFEVPVHRALIELFQQLDGQLPDEIRVSLGDAPCEVASQRVESAQVTVWRSRYATMVGQDPRLFQVFRFIDRVAPGETTVLLSGESGTGKELAAEAIHRQSERVDGPFIRVNCAAFVEELLLSELFGHEKGAFTGALRQKEGLFELADGGTLFLDEIGDISPKTQVALLRVLQQGTFERVGGTETRQVDVRVVAATNRDLETLVKEGGFRLDLYYRLKGFVIEMPALRERREDIPLLLEHFATKFSAGTPAPGFAPEVMQFLARYSWRGNIRELENFVQSVLLFVEGPRVELHHLKEFEDFSPAPRSTQPFRISSCTR